MYICVCHALTTADAERVRAGETTALARVMKSVRGCGMCAHRLRQLLTDDAAQPGGEDG